MEEEERIINGQLFFAAINLTLMIMRQRERQRRRQQQ